MLTLASHVAPATQLAGHLANTARLTIHTPVVMIMPQPVGKVTPALSLNSEPSLYGYVQDRPVLPGIIPERHYSIVASSGELVDVR